MRPVGLADTTHDWVSDARIEATRKSCMMSNCLDMERYADVAAKRSYGNPGKAVTKQIEDLPMKSVVLLKCNE